MIAQKSISALSSVLVMGHATATMGTACASWVGVARRVMRTNVRAIQPTGCHVGVLDKESVQAQAVFAKRVSAEATAASKTGGPSGASRCVVMSVRRSASDLCLRRTRLDRVCPMASILAMCRLQVTSVLDCEGWKCRKVGWIRVTAAKFPA